MSKTQKPLPPPAAQSVAAAPGAPPSPQAPASAPTAPGAPAAAAAVALAVLPEQRTVVEQPGWYRVELTSYGAAITSYELLNSKYFTRDMRRLVLRDGQTVPIVDRRQTDGPTNLVAGYRPALLTRFTEHGGGFELPKVPAFTLAANETLPDGTRELVYVLDTADYKLEKRFTFPPNTFTTQLRISVQNKKTTPVNYHLELGLEGFQDPTQKPGGTFSARVPQNEVAWDNAKKYSKLDLESLRSGKEDADKLRGDLRWIGIGQQYFLFAAGLPHGQNIGDKQGRVHAEDNGELSISAEFSEHTLSPGETRSYHLAVYGGPKMPDLLDEVKLDGQPVGLNTAIDYTLESLARPMLRVLRLLYDLTHNWPIAIVLLTLLIKLLLLYPSHRSMVSMKAMGKLKPEIDVLRDKCGDDKQKFNTEMMALYKKHNINPLGGCLPILLQMPIYFALYSMLGNAVELYRVKLFWIQDLTAADPYFILPLFTGGLMYVQSKFLSPAPVDPQQKAMTTMMPLMFTVFTVFVPAGLTLYIMTNTVLGMLQQLVINRGMDKTPPASAPAAPAPPQKRSAKS